MLTNLASSLCPNLVVNCEFDNRHAVWGERVAHSSRRPQSDRARNWHYHIWVGKVVQRGEGSGVEQCNARRLARDPKAKGIVCSVGARSGIRYLDIDELFLYQPKRKRVSTLIYTILLLASWLATQWRGTLELGAGEVLITCVPRLVLNNCRYREQLVGID